MKKLLITLLSLMLVGLSLNVQAASVTFDPTVADYSIAPGESGSKSITLQGFSSRPYTLYLTVGSVLQHSTIPPGWLNIANLALISRTGGSSSTTVNLVVNVPPDAAPGFYSGLLLPENSPRSTEVVTGPGLIVTIDVAGIQPACVNPPEFSEYAVGPQGIWAPNDRDIEIEISGILSVTDGCEVAAGYTLESNDGLIQGDIAVSDDGSFSQKVTVNLSRSGQDKFGRTYNGTLFVIDGDGNQTSHDFFVTVLHDKGQKKGWNK